MVLGFSFLECSLGEGFLYYRKSVERICSLYIMNFLLLWVWKLKLKDRIYMTVNDREIVRVIIVKNGDFYSIGLFLDLH